MEESRTLHPPPLPEGETWLSLDEVMRIFGLARQTVYVQRVRGNAPGVLGVLWNHRLWWRLSDVNRLLAERLIEQPDANWSKRNAKPIKTVARATLDKKKREAREAARKAAQDVS